jgi:DsbC/DsbD-like thiol-disulfide interchange protein
MVGMRTPRRNTVAILWAAFLLPSGASAVTRHTQSSLVSEVESIRPGASFTVAIRLQMDEGWHTYWKNPADSGLPTRMSWRLPEGLTAGPLQWPRPERLAAPPLLSYGYEGDVLLPVEIVAAQTLKPGTPVELAGRVDWLECREACIPGKAELSLVLPRRALGFRFHPGIGRWRPGRAATRSFSPSIAQVPSRARPTSSPPSRR